MDEEQKKLLSDKAKADQAAATLADILPPIIRRLFDNFQGVGFDPDQSFKLCQTWILMQCPNGVKGTG